MRSYGKRLKNMIDNPIIIPQQNHGLITEVASDGITIIAKFDIPYNSISKIINNETIVTLDKAEKRLLLHNIDGSFIKSIRVPFGMAMNVKEHVVYIGGNAREGEVCYMVDLESKNHAIQNITLPEPMSCGKAVDDILILSNKMLLIDNIVYPKYTFEYDISEPNNPKWIKTIELPHSRAYENIIKGDMNEAWMVYLSTSSSGWTCDEAHITIEGKYNNEISSLKKDSIVDICLVGDSLYALTDIGLGVFDLNEQELSVESIKLIEHERVADKIIRIDDTKLLLVSKYGYEMLDVTQLTYFDGGIEERFWTYGSLDLNDKELTEFPEEKIKDLTKLEHLDLSNNDLKVLPESLRQCKQLRSLNLYNSGITEIPKWISEFDAMEYLNLSGIDIGYSKIFNFDHIKFPKNLKTLNLRYCQLLRIPPDVFKLKKLEYLNIKENSLLWLPGKIGNLKNLQTLKADWPFVYVSKRMGELKKMTSLNLTDGFRRKIPTFVYHMAQLKRLDASSANIETITSDIKNLVNLEYLDLNSNYDLENIPDEICQIKNLKVLNLSVCGLQTLPQSIHNLTNLEALNLSSNHLTTLKKEDFADMQKLKKIDLYSNKPKEPPMEVPVEAQKKKPLVRLPKYKTFGYDTWMLDLWKWADDEGIRDYQWSELGGGTWSGLPRDKETLETFKEFNIRFNYLDSLPKEIGKLTSVTKMDFKDNAFKTLPKEIGKLKNLTYLDLKKNKLETLPKEIGDLKSLTKLDLCDNVLQKLPSEIGNLTNLIDLDISYNRLKELPIEIGNLINLKRLDVGGRTQLKYLPNEIGKLENLEILDVAHNQLIELPKEIGNLREVKELWIGGNVLTTLPKELSKLTNLTKLCATYSPITNLPDLRNFKQLTELRFDSTQLTEVSKDIGELINLTWLDLSRNDLHRLPDKVTNLVNLETLSLRDNKNLVLTKSQENWIEILKDNGCSVDMGIDNEFLDVTR